MKNKKMYRKLLGVVVVLFICVLAVPNTAKAYDDWLIRNMGKNFKTTTVMYSSKDNCSYEFEPYFAYKDGMKNFKVKLSKPKIGKIMKSKYGSFSFMPRKAGTTKITVSADVGGKKEICKGTIKVVKFTQPFKSFTIGGKSYRGRVKGTYNLLRIKLKKKSANVNYKLNKGWKVESIQDGWYDETKTKKTHKLTKKPGKNGMMFIYLKHKKTGAKVMLEIYSRDL